MLTDALKDHIRDAYARIKDGLPGFRGRPAQLRMIAEVAKALAQPAGAAVIEAPLRQRVSAPEIPAPSH